MKKFTKKNKTKKKQIVLAKYFRNCLKNHMNEIRTNEIRIRRENPVYNILIIIGMGKEIIHTAKY